MLNIFLDQHNLFRWWLPACGKNTLMYFFQSMDGLTINWFDIECLFSIFYQINFNWQFLSCPILSVNIAMLSQFQILVSTNSMSCFCSLSRVKGHSSGRSDTHSKGTPGCSTHMPSLATYLCALLILWSSCTSPGEYPIVHTNNLPWDTWRSFFNASNSSFAIRTVIRPYSV